VDLDSVELEQDELARCSRAAQAAVPGLKHRVLEAKERLARAQEQGQKARDQAACEELKGVEARRDELAGELREVFEVHSRVHVGSKLQNAKAGTETVALSRFVKRGWFQPRYILCCVLWLAGRENALCPAPIG
jgi:hypothetical protein